jgi:asparagine synthase (glutamine-hydrolysing)
MPDIQRQPAAYLKRFWDIGSGEMDSPFFSHLPRWRLTSKIKEFLSPEVRAATMGFDAIGDLGGALPADYGSWGPFGQAEYLESTLLLPGYILSSQGDRVAMAHGVEARYPFLDHRVVEFAGRLPARLKMKVLEEKHLLRRLAEGRIPESVRVRPKQPYRAPDGSSFFGPHATLVDEMLAPERVRAGGVFDADRVAGLVGKFRSGRPTSVRDDMSLVGILSTQIVVGELRG